MKIKFSSRIYLLIAIVFLLLIKAGISYVYAQGIDLDKIKYHYHVSDLTPISTDDFNNLLAQHNSDTSLIFVGRDTCPTCISAIEHVSDIFNLCDSTLNSQTIHKYYYDTKQYDEKAAVELRNSLGIAYIPAIIVIHEGQILKFDEENLLVSDYSTIFQDSILSKINY